MFRITGLDPAGPSFKGIPDDRRLSRDDGMHIDTILVDTTFLGMNISTGHVNFWVNGGASLTCKD